MVRFPCQQCPVHRQRASEAGSKLAHRFVPRLEVDSGDAFGAVARPAMVRFVATLPKTRSGKLLRRAIQAVCEGRDPGDLTTMDDPAALQQIVELIKG